jgi:hypothetical protein
LVCPNHEIAGERGPSPPQCEFQIGYLGPQRLAGSPAGAEEVGTKDTSAKWGDRLKGIPEVEAGETAAIGVMSRLASTLTVTDP